MKKAMKRVVSILVASVLFCCCAFNVFAAEVDVHGKDYAEMSTEELAYCDLDETTDEAVRQAILDARREIIYSTNWTVDGQLEIVNADGTVEALPEFSDLFPGWEIPEMTSTERYSIKVEVRYFAAYVNLKTATTTDADPFARIILSSNSDLFVQATGIPGDSWNCGAFDVTAGRSAGYATDMPDGVAARFARPVKGHEYAIRASSNGAAGQAYIMVFQGTVLNSI